MKDYQQRVVEEKAELDAKIEKLREFHDGDVWKTLDRYQHTLLDSQLWFMCSYSRILGERIAGFKGLDPLSGYVSVSVKPIDK